MIKSIHDKIIGEGEIKNHFSLNYFSFLFHFSYRYIINLQVQSLYKNVYVLFVCFFLFFFVFIVVKCQVNYSFYFVLGYYNCIKTKQLKKYTKSNSMPILAFSVAIFFVFIYRTIYLLLQIQKKSYLILYDFFL